MREDTEALEEVVHEVNSKASSLKGAAGLLRKAAPADRDKLLDAMAQHAQGLARFINRFRQNGEERP